jgi:K+-transporting ATPase KdpF subunit
VSVMTALGGALAIGLFFFLGVALLYPEKLS